MKQLRDEKAELLRNVEEIQNALGQSEEQSKELARIAEEWKGAARQTIAEMKRGTRIMVTAPKVCINVGNGQDIDVHVPFPIQAIRDSVKNEVVPKFAKVC